MNNTDSPTGAIFMAIYMFITTLIAGIFVIIILGKIFEMNNNKKKNVTIKNFPQSWNSDKIKTQVNTLLDGFKTTFIAEKELNGEVAIYVGFETRLAAEKFIEKHSANKITLQGAKKPLSIKISGTKPDDWIDGGIKVFLYNQGDNRYIYIDKNWTGSELKNAIVTKFKIVKAFDILFAGTVIKDDEILGHFLKKRSRILITAEFNHGLAL
jgi:hypothetical protein